MDYIAPSYDIWKLGCLLFEAATGGRLFHADLRQAHLRVRQTDRGYNDQHFILACMVRVLGLFPRQVRGIAIQSVPYSAVQSCTV
jgi:serine/threonine protein kinase